MSDNRSIREDLSAYLDGELEEALRAEAEQAIAEDPELAAELAAFRAVDAAYRGAPAPQAPATLEEAIRGQIKEGKSSRRVRRFPSTPRLLAAACVAIAGAGILYAAWAPSPTQPALEMQMAAESAPAPPSEGDSQPMALKAPAADSMDGEAADDAARGAPMQRFSAEPQAESEPPPAEPEALAMEPAPMADEAQEADAADFAVIGTRRFERRDDAWVQAGYKGEETAPLARDAEALAELLPDEDERAAIRDLDGAVTFRAAEAWHRLEAPEADSERDAP